MASGKKRFYRTANSARSAQKSSWVAHKWANGGPDSDRNRKAGPENPKHGRAVAAYSFYGRTNRAEQAFLRFAATKGLRVHRNGWPDFFCENPDGGVAAVEVKNGIGDPLSPEQVTCMEMLARSGIETFIWNRSRSKQMGAAALVPWKDYVADRPVMDIGAKATGQAKTSAETDLKLQAHANPVSEDGRIPEVLEDPRTIH